MRGELVNACLLIFAGLASQIGIRVYVLPDHLLSTVLRDTTQELLLPVEFDSYHAIVGSVQMHSHWYAYAFDNRDNTLYFLDSLGGTSVIRDSDRKKKLSVLYCYLLKKPFSSVEFDNYEKELKDLGWNVVTSPTFSQFKGFTLPLQRYGNDCGIFVIMYCWNIIFSRKFRFNVEDMPQIRQRLAIMLLAHSNNAAVKRACDIVPFSKWNMKKFILLEHPNLQDIHELDEQMYKAICWLRGNKNIFRAEVHEPPVVNKSVSERRILFLNQEETLENLCDANGSWEANEDARHKFMANFTFMFEDLPDMLLFQEKLDAISVTVNMLVIQ